MTNLIADNEQENLKAVRKDGLIIRHIKNPSEAVQLAAVQETGFALPLIENPSEAVQLAAVQQTGWAVNCLLAPSEEVQMAAIRQTEWAIQYIKNPSEAVQLAAVRKNGLTLEHINAPSETVQLAAFSSGGFAAAAWWSDSFAPSAVAIRQAIQESELPFSAAEPEDDPFAPQLRQLHASGIRAVQSCLTSQPSSDLLDLAAVAPALFDPPELREILRNALLEQASPPQSPLSTRSI